MTGGKTSRRNCGIPLAKKGCERRMGSKNKNYTVLDFYIGFRNVAKIKLEVTKWGGKKPTTEGKRVRRNTGKSRVKLGFKKGLVSHWAQREKKGRERKMGRAPR